MLRLQTMVLSAGVLAMAACAEGISTDYNPSVQFAQYRTFAMVPRPDRLSHQLLDDRIREDVAFQLGKKGLTQTNRDQADLLVGYGIVDHTYKEVYHTGWPYGPGWGWRYYRWGVAWPMDTREIARYTDGTVVVSLVDAKTHRAVWQGQAQDVLRLPVGNPEHASDQLAQAVARIFHKFPPANRA
jgi:Domain of unknown function (DUF4136)